MNSALTILQTKLTPPEVRAVLLALNHPALLEQYEIQQQILFAVDRLNNGWRSADLARFMVLRFGIGKTTAYRRIDAALSHRSRYREKNPCNDEPIVIEGRLPSRVLSESDK